MDDYLNYLKNPKLIFTSIDYSLFHQRRAYVENFVGMKSGDLDPVNNDWEPNSEQRIQSDSANYYKNSINKFYKRSPIPQISKSQIDVSKERYLKKIYFLFQKHNTKYKIVVAPLYDQVAINPKDLSIITGIFGKADVFDYSGVNSITNNKFNYSSDVIHYRKKVGNLIFKTIYK